MDELPSPKFQLKEYGGTPPVVFPVKSTVSLHNPMETNYVGRWFNPITNRFTDAVLSMREGLLKATSLEDSDMLLVLEKK